MKALGHPDHTYVLVYPGGYCGEFLCHWLGQHDGCVSTPTSSLENNRYVTKFDRIKIHPRANTLKLFLPGHDQVQYQAKNGFVATDPSRVIGVRACAVYQKFYFLLFVLKTLLFKYNADTHVLEEASPESMSKFLTDIYPRRDFYYDEFAAWQSTQSVPGIDYLLEKRFKKGCNGIDISTADFNIDLDQLFFGNFLCRATEYQRLCDSIGIVADSGLLSQLDQYHARNLDLVRNAINMSVQDFVSLSDSQAWEIVLSVRHAVDQRLV